MRSKKRANSSRTRNPVRKAFDPRIAREAAKLAKRLGKIVAFDPETAEFVARCVEMPRVIGAGGEATEAEKALREAVEFTLSCMIEADEPLPEPASEPRQAQLNIRLTERERVLYEAASRQMGLSSVADLFRLSVREKMRMLKTGKSQNGRRQRFNRRSPAG